MLDIITIIIKKFNFSINMKYEMMMTIKICKVTLNNNGLIAICRGGTD